MDPVEFPERDREVRWSLLLCQVGLPFAGSTKLSTITIHNARPVFLVQHTRSAVARRMMTGYTPPPIGTIFPSLVPTCSPLQSPVLFPSAGGEGRRGLSVSRAMLARGARRSPRRKCAGPTGASSMVVREATEATKQSADRVVYQALRGCFPPRPWRRFLSRSTVLHGID
jgi:hypothetical protein